MNQPRVLYLGHLHKGGTCLERFLALKELGYEIEGFDTSGIWSGVSAPMRRLSWRLMVGSAVRQFNRSLERSAKKMHPDVVWFDKVVEVTPLTIKAIKERTRAILVHYNPDDPFGRYRVGWRLFRKAIPLYDLHLVARDQNIQEYMAFGAKRIERLYRGYSERFHRPDDESGKPCAKLHEVGFIGSYERERAEILRYLTDRCFPLALWGRTWSRQYGQGGKNLTIYPEGVYAEDYVAAIRSCKINLNFLRAGNRDLSNSRAYEIPACGGFMLSERSAELEDEFDDGKEVEFFSSKEEAADKIRYYLAHDVDRERIAANGRQRCLECGYSYKSRMRQYMDIVNGMLDVRTSFYESGKEA